MTQPLSGTLVVSLEHALAGPYATRQLADLGARVIKIERPGVGDFARRYDESTLGQSSYFVWANRSKESLTLDIKAPEGAAVLADLLARADVFVQNLAPSATRRLGLDAATLAQRYPRLVVCDISGYGSDGPWAQRKAYDLLVQGESGLLSITGTPEHIARVGISVADIATAMYAYSGILAALLQRATTGRAPAVSVSLFDAMAEWMSQPALYAAYSGTQPARSGADHPSIVPYGPFATGDGGAVIVAIQNEREWAVFCAQVLGDAELARDPRFCSSPSRFANREAVHDRVQRVLGGLSTAEACELLEANAIANARVNSLNDFLAHPVLTDRGRWVMVDTPGGDVRVLRPPADLTGVPLRADPVPELGAHTEAILRELGRTPGEIDKLRSDGVV